MSIISFVSFLMIPLRTYLLLWVWAGLACCKGDKPSPQTEEPPSFELQTAGIINVNAINEASGLAASYTNPTMLWTHNDSGDKNRVFLMNNQGNWQATYTMEGCQNIDYEDIASLKTPTQNYVFVADIGDNDAVRNQHIIYKFKEPVFAENTTDFVIKNIEKITFRYEDSPHDAECLMIDPLTQDLYVVTKREARSRVYVLAYPQSTGAENIAKFITELPFNYVTAGDISGDGQQILVKNYGQVFYWKKALGQTLAQTLQQSPANLTYRSETQGEAICWASNGQDYYTTSEGQNQPLYFYKKK